jgi:hypothetical protein
MESNDQEHESEVEELPNKREDVLEEDKENQKNSTQKEKKMGSMSVKERQMFGFMIGGHMSFAKFLQDRMEEISIVGNEKEFKLEEKMGSLRVKK